MTYNKDKEEVKVILNTTIDSLIKAEQGNIMENTVIDVPDYRYGGSQEQLDGGYQIRNLGGKFKIGNFTITANGDLSITGVGFKPSMVQFFPNSGNGNTADTGMGAMTAINQFAVNNQNSGFITSQAIYYGNPVKAKGAFASMDNDGFTITISGYTAYTDVGYIAFK